MLPPNLQAILEKLKKTSHYDTISEQARKDMIAELEKVSETLDNLPVPDQRIYKTFGARSTDAWGGSQGKCGFCGK